MNIENIIKNRRNIKPENFIKDKIIDNEILKTILEAANWAPTHGKTEPWRFFIFDKQNIEKFATLHANFYKEKTSLEDFDEDKFLQFQQRPLLASHFIVLGCKTGANKKIHAIEELIATSCAIQNMLLVASSLNVGVYWGTGMTMHPEFKLQLGLGENDFLLGYLMLGYAENIHHEGKRNSGIDSKVSWM